MLLMLMLENPMCARTRQFSPAITDELGQAVTHMSVIVGTGKIGLHQPPLGWFGWVALAELP